MVGIIDSIGTESALFVAVAVPLIVDVATFLVAAGDEESSTELPAPEPETVELFRCCGPIKVPSNGEVTCCMSPVLGAFNFVNFEGFFVPSPCADNVRFKMLATSVGPTAVLIIPATPGPSETSEEYDCSNPLTSLRSFGRSTNVTSSSLAFLMRLRASWAISGPVSLPLSARILLGSDVMTRVAFAMALRVAPCIKI